MRLSQLLNLEVARDSVGITKAFSRHLDSEDPEILEALTGSRSELDSVLAPAASITVDLTGLSPKVIYVETDAKVTVSINGAAVKVSAAIGIAAVPISGKLLLWTESVTTLTIANTGTSAAKVTWMIAG